MPGLFNAGEVQDDKTSLLEHANRYNAVLRGEERSWSEDGLDTYDQQLSLDAAGTMCWLKIPSIGVEQPVHHHADPDSLMSGVGHVEGTSLPVGGASTHCVIAGHTGMPGQRMFDDVDKLMPGIWWRCMSSGTRWYTGWRATKL